VSGAVSIVAGAPAVDAVWIGASMALIQFGIGATNDVVDAPTDAGLKPGKPIPAGVVSKAEGSFVAIAAFAAGALLAVPSGPLLVGLAVVVAGIGLAYDLRLKGTAWSWLPFAVGIPILPVYGWVGSGSPLPSFFAILVPAGVAAGAALAVSNALVDVDRDRAAGVESVALRLGADRAWAVHTALLGLVATAAVVSAVALVSLPGAIAVAVGGVVPLAGAAMARGTEAGARERAWEVEAIGMAILAIAWLGVVALPPAPGS
jgi:4-hydroxybenzoate polyprenyltransferase